MKLVECFKRHYEHFLMIWMVRLMVNKIKKMFSNISLKTKFEISSTTEAMEIEITEILSTALVSYSSYLIYQRSYVHQIGNNNSNN